MSKYTGREIAIFSDVHGLLQPVTVILEDIKRRGIKEIYSLGDNVGFGPKPAQVLELINKYNVKSLNGNSEEYCVLGIEPFASYFDELKTKSQEWTMSHLTDKQIEKLKNNKHSIDLNIGGKKVGLCHFINDVRIDYGERSTWSYQKSINEGLPEPQKQFYYTNSKEQLEIISEHSKSVDPVDKGYVSAKEDPIFGGKPIDYYDEIIQGHVHFGFYTEDENVKVRTVRAVGMAFTKDKLNMAYYIIVKEKEEGYDIEEVLVPFDRQAMLDDIDNSTMPDKITINKYISRD